MIPCPYPEPTPACDSKRFIEALNSLGDNNEWKYIGLIRMLHLFGKLDEMSDMIEKYTAYIHQHDNDPIIDNQESASIPFVAGEFSASDEESFLDELRAMKDE